MLFLVILPLAMAYQIRRRQLFDLDRIVSRILWALGNFAALVVVFGVPAGAAVLVCRQLELDRSLETLLAVLAGLAAVSVARDPLSRRLSKVIDLNPGVHGPSVIAEFSNAASRAQSADEVIELLFDLLQRCYQPLDLRLLDRKGDGYMLKPRGVAEGMSRPAKRSDLDLEANETEETRQLLLTPEAALRHLSTLGRWKAHAYLVLPIGDHRMPSATGANTNLRDASLVLIGPRTDGKAYSSEAAGLVATLVRLAAERLRLLTELPTIAQTSPTPGPSEAG
jgi:eukaryotic-like serine/threonine-protein kinase